VTPEADRVVGLRLQNPQGGGALGSLATALLTIRDDDSVLGYALNGFTVSESGGSASISVRRAGGSAGTNTVGYATVAETGFGKATAGSDYTGVTNTLTFADGVTNQTFNVVILQDALTEVPETVRLVLTNAAGAGGASATNAAAGGAAVLGQTVYGEATLTIQDDESSAGTLGFELAAYAVNEEAGSLTVNVQRSAGSAGTVTVQYQTAERVVTADTATERLLRTAHGLTDGTVLEFATSGTLPGGLLTGTAYTVTNATANDFQVLSGGSVLDLTSTGSGTHWYAATGQALGGSLPANDYTPTSGTLTFANGEIQKNFVVSITPDNLAPVVEGNETFTLTLANATGGATLGVASATVTIVDNDSQVNLVGAPYSVSEEAGSVTITARRTGGTNGTVAVYYKTETPGSGTVATAGTDYTIVPAGAQTLTSVASDTVTLNGHGLIAGNPVVFETSTSGSLVGVVLNSVSYVVTNAAANTFQVTSNGVLVTLGVLTDPVTVRPALVWSSGDAADKTFMVRITDDLAQESGEDFQVTLTAGPAGSATVALGATNTALVTILDNDGATGSGGAVDVAFATGTGPNTNVTAVALQVDGKIVAGGQFTNFNGTTVNRLVRLNTNGTVDAAFVTALGTGFSNTVNAVAVDQNTNALAVTNVGKIIVAGQFTNAGATVVGRLARLNANGSVDTSFTTALAGGANNSVSAVLVQPDGKVLLGGSFTAVGGTVRNFLARLNVDGALDTGFLNGLGGFNGPVRALALDGGGNVVVGGGFTLINGVARTNLARLSGVDGSLDTGFTVGTDGTVLSVAVQPDGKVVFGGQFTQVNATNASAAVGYLARVNNDGVLDNSGAFPASASDFVNTIVVQSNLFAANDFRLLVGGSFTTLSGVSRGRLARLLANGTLDSEINFGSGANDAVLAAAAAADGKLVVGGVFTTYDGTTARHLVRLQGGLNQGAGTLNFSAASYDVNENAGSVTVTVTRTGGLSGAASVPVTSSYGTASGADFTAVNTTLNFLAGQQSASFTIAITPSPAVNTPNPRTATVDLGVPTGAALGATFSAALNIRDVDSVLAFAQATYNVVESQGSVNIALSRTGGTNGAVSVSYRTVAETGFGKATNGVDYTGVTNTVSFADSVVSSFFTVTITQDALTEGNETVSLELFSPSTNAVLGLAAAALTIIDDETSPGVLGFSTAAYAVAEENGAGGATNLVVTVQRAAGSAGLVQVNYATTNSGAAQATAGTDYTAASGTLTFADGEILKTFVVNLTPDVLVEGDETFGLILTNVTGGASLGASNATVTILDNDSQLAFQGAPYSTSETNGSFTVTLTRTGGTNGSVSVVFQTLERVATADATADTLLRGAHGLTNGTALQFASTGALPGGLVAGTGYFLVNSNLNDFQVSLTPGGAAADLTSVGSGTLSYAPLGQALGGLTRVVTADFTADTLQRTAHGLVDGTVLRFASSGTLPAPLATGTDYFVVTSTANDFQLALTLGGGAIDLTDAGTGVHYYAPVGEMLGGTDYTLTNQTVVFADGQVTATVDLQLANEAHDDRIIEGDEVITLTLSGAASVLGGGSAVIAPAGDTTTLTLVDNEIELAFTSATYTFSENATNALIEVVRSGVTNLAVSVGFSTADGPGTRSGLDYLTTNGVLSFAANVLTQSFNVPIVDNTVTNPNRSVTLTLAGAAGPFGTQLGAVNAATLVITDNDPAQVAGTNDTGFAATFSGAVHALGIVTNTGLPTLVNKLVVVGDFTNVNGVAQNFITRLNRDGTRDTTFNIGTGADNPVRAVAVAPDGKVYVGGLFNVLGGNARFYLGRLDSNGALDGAFSGGSGADNAVLALALQLDGRLLVGGQFTSLAGQPRGFVGRLNSDGSDDATFANGSGADNFVRAILLLPDGSIIIGGDFTSVDGVSSPRLAKLTADGVVDAGFASTLTVAGGFDGPIFSLGLQQGTNIVVGGQFTTAGGVLHLNLARVRTNGVVDNTFTAAANDYVNEVVVQADDKLVLGGGFTTVNGLVQNRVARLLDTGALDTTINFGFGANADVETVLVQPYDDRIVLGGQFTNFNGTAYSRLVRVNGRDTGGAGTLSLSATNYTVGESGPTVMVSILRFGGLTGSLTATNVTADGTATNGVHYTGVTNEFTLADGVSSTNFLVGIIDPVGDGTNIARVFNTLLISGGITNTSTVTIVDNDAIPNFTLATYSASEAGGSVVISVARRGGSANAYTVEFATANGTAVAGVNYGATNGTLAWADGDVANKTFTVGVTNNAITNGNLTVNLSLFNATNTTLGAATTLSGQTNAVLNILDDESGPGQIGFLSAGFSVAENAGAVTITVIRTNGSSGSMSASFSTIAGGTATAGVDYASTNGSFTWPNGDSSSRTFTVSVTNNFITNSARTVNLRIPSIVGAATPGITNAVLTITDDDSLVGFSTNAFTVNETGAAVGVTIVRSGATNTAVSVTLATTDGTATTGSDYLGVTNVISFQPGETSTNFLLTIVDDAPVDLADAGSGTISYSGGGAGVVTADPVTDRLQSPAHGLANGVILQFASTGTLPAGLVAGTNYFVINTTANDFQVALVAGGPTVEANETVLLNLFAPVGAVVFDVLLAPTNATLTIVDNETELAFSSATYTVGENGTNLAITVVRTGVTNTAVTVNFSATSGTAIDGLDYVSTNGTLTFAANVLTQTFAITIFDNTVSNLDRTVLLALASPAGPFGTQLGVPNTAVLTITNNDPAAVAGTADPSFAATINGTVYGLDINTNTALPALIGKLVIAGDFTTVNGSARTRIARLNRNGTLDPTFNPGTGANDSVRALAVQGDGKVIIGGFFTNVVSTARNFIARLNVNGSLDATFNPGTGPDGQVNAVVLQPDGKVVIGGQFTSVNGTNQSFIARLNGDGSLDTTFDTGAGASAAVRALALLGDGSIIAGGDFQFFNGMSTRGLARLDSNGTVDFLFSANLGAGGVNGSVVSIAVQQATNLVVGGTFADVDGTARQNLARFGTNGVLDAAFNTPVDNTVNAISAQPDGKLLLGGGFSTVGGVARSRAARLTETGALDPAINFGSGADNDVTVSLVQFYDDQIVFGGAFGNFGGVAATRLVRLNGRDNTGSGVIEFSQTNFVYNEATLAVITVSRSGGLSNTVTAQYQTVERLATVVGGKWQRTAHGLADGAVVQFNTDGTLPGTVGTGTNYFVRDSTANDFNVAATSGGTALALTGGSGNHWYAGVGQALGGTVASAGDYTTASGTLTFASGVNQLSFTVTNINDTSVEGNETVNLALANPTGGAVLGANSNAVMSIADNDARLAFSIGVFNVSESTANALVSLVRTGGTNGAVTVDFATAAGGAATAGTDYVATNGTVTFADGITAASFNVRILGDTNVEGNETVLLALSNPNGVGSASAVLGTISTATLNILDDDFSPGTLSFSTNSFSVSENGASVTITVTRSIGTLGLVSVNYATVNGSALAGSDFNATSGTLSWPDGDSNPRTFSVTVNDDAFVEGNENFNVTLSGASGGAALNLTNAVVTVIDDDGVVQFSLANFVVAENITNATVTVIRTGATNNLVTVNYTTLATGSATPGVDFTTVSGQLTFTNGVTNQTFTVPVINDQFAEPNETIDLTLTNLVGNAFLGGFSSAIITIVDDDIGLQFASTNFSVLESGPNATITVLRTGATNSSVSVNFSTSDGTAVAGQDYVTQIGTLNFAPGDTTKTFSITILDDAPVEADETVNLLLSNPTGGAVLSSPSTATLTIVNDDTGVEFTAALYTVAENTANALISVRRIGVTTGAFTVGFATSNNTAVAGVNYVATNGTLTFAAGVSSNAFQVRTIDDAVPLGDKVLDLFLLNPLGGAVLGPQATAVLQINDNEVTLQFSAATYSVLEDQTNAVITVTRFGSGGGTVGVSFTASAGSATAGTDFATTNGTLSFAAGITNLTFAVRLLDDILSETNETVNLTLSAPTGVGAALGTPSVATLRVVDNERVGSLDSLFLTAAGANGDVQAIGAYTNTASTNFGKVIIAGDFQSVDGVSRGRLARLNVDGTLDPSFNPAAGANNVVYAVAIQTNDQVLIGGAFATVGGVARPFVARLNEDGSLDAAYNAAGAGPNGSVLALALQPDGKLVIGGGFTTYNLTARSRLARLNTDGTLDAAFNPGGASDLVQAIAIEPGTTNIIVAGLFNTFSGSPRSQIARLTPAGALDAAFAPTLSAGAQLYALAVQADGKVLVGGSFTNIGPQSRTNVARLQGADGSIDPAFNAAAAANSTVRALAIEASGRVLVGGDFTLLNGAGRAGFGRLNSDGTLDAGYDPGLAANGFVFAIATTFEGKAVMGGHFTTVDGVSRGNVARVNGDHGVLQFVSATASILERGTNVTLSVARQNGASGAITVDYGTTNGTATAGDYVVTNGTLTFGPGVTNQDIVVVISNDTAVEGNETFTVGLQNVVGGTLGAQIVSTVTIVDDDSALQFSVTATNVLEDIGSLVLTVDRAGVIDTLVTLPFNTADGAALHGGDYTGVTNILTFDTNVSSQTITLPILNDQIEETNETFTVVLGTPVGEASLGTNTTVVVTVLDNDSTLFLTTNAATAFESAGSITLSVSRTGYTNNNVTAAFTTADGTAVAVGDYTAQSGSLAFNAGITNLDVTLVLVNDLLQEATETFSLLLTNVTGEASLGLVTSAAITVLDNDSTLFLTANAATVVESAGTVTFTAVRTGYTNTTVMLPFSTVDGTAAAGSDFTLTTNVLTFDTNVVSQSIVIPILNDTVVESTEAFTLQLYTPAGEASLAGTNTSATITITDDDSTLQFSAAAGSVVESVGGITLTVVRAGTLNSTVTVPFGTTNGTAFAGSDYTATNGQLTFATNVTTATITIPIANDTVVEPDETFTVGLGAPTGQASLGVNAAEVVTILNDDSTLQFTAASYSVIERMTNVTLTVSRTGSLDSTVTVPYASANVTAFAGADYTTTSGTLTFGTNAAASNIVVTILNDKLLESGETFTVTLGTPGGEASLGTPNVATVTILDDESTLEFAATNVTSVLESGGLINLTVTRVGVIDTTVSAPFTIGDVSAVNGTDYLGTNGVLTFDTNVSAQVVTVGILNDLVVETNKTFTITLGTPTGEALLGLGRVATVTVLDDDSILQFPFTQLNVAESAGNLSITVQRLGATNVAVAVDLATADGLTRTATANVDYNSVTTNLVLGVGESAKSVVAYLTNDFTEEGTESFRVLLSNATGQATLGSQSNLTVNIIDDDFRTLIAAGVTLLAESFTPANSSVDPLETVTVNFALRNVGNVAASNITATLLATGGVLAPSTPQVYTNLPAGGAALAMPFTFTATQAQTITATLQLSDTNGGVGAAIFTIDLGVASSHTNRNLINIPGTLSVPSVGPANPYPSSLVVSNVAGVVNKVSVRLNGFTHTYPADVDILLVSPTGQKVLLMSDAGSGFSVTNLTLTFDDVVTASVPELSPITSGTYRPSDYAPADSFPAPAPAGPYAGTLSAFSGFSPNGTWSLYIVDDTDQNLGNIVNGWTLNLSTVNAAIDLAATMTNAPTTVTAPGTVVFTTVITNRGPNIAAGVTYSNVLPAGLTFVSATATAGGLTNVGGTVVGSLGALGTGSNHVVTLTVSTSGSGQVTNVAQVFSTEVELAPADNTASAVVTIAPGIPFSLLGARQTNGQFFVTVTNAIAGRTYVLEGTTNFVNPMTSTVWTPLGTNVAAGSVFTLPDTGAGTLRSRFYRVIER